MLVTQMKTNFGMSIENASIKIINQIENNDEIIFTHIFYCVFVGILGIIPNIFIPQFMTKKPNNYLENPTFY